MLDNTDTFFFSALVLLTTIISFILGIMYQHTREVEISEDFYKTTCIAAPGQVSVMKWVNGVPPCTRIEPLVKHGDNLKDWRD